MRRIVLASGKGGVGRTTITANLGLALAKKGKSTLLVDACLSSPNLGLLFRLERAPYTLNDVLRGEIPPSDAIYEGPHGLKIVPSSPSGDLRGVDWNRLPPTLDSLGERVEFMLIDTPGGLRKETVATLRAGQEILLLTLPEITSLSDTLRTKVLLEFLGLRPQGILLNRVRGKDYEFPAGEIRRLLDLPILGEIPEDLNVRRSWRKGEPFLELYPRSPASKSLTELAEKLSRKVSLPQSAPGGP
ncbi:MAG: septum site-determining protein MinD, partial [Hadesarchaea archaeon]